MTTSTTAPTVSVRPILYTDHTDEWLAILRTLGLRVLTRDGGWTLLATSSGRIALHTVYDGVVEGGIALGFETTDLDAYAAAHGLDVRDTAYGRAVQVRATDGTDVVVDEVEAVTDALDAPTEQADHVELTQVWVTPDVEQTSRDLEALGLTRLFDERNGRTTTLAAGAGRVLVHTDDGNGTGTSLGIDVDDLEVCHAALLAIGVRHDVIDETFGRTLRVPTPGSDGMLWVQQPDDDPVGVVRA